MLHHDAHKPSSHFPHILAQPFISLNASRGQIDFQQEHLQRFRKDDIEPIDLEAFLIGSYGIFVGTDCMKYKILQPTVDNPFCICGWFAQLFGCHFEEFGVGDDGGSLVVLEGFFILGVVCEVWFWAVERVERVRLGAQSAIKIFIKIADNGVEARHQHPNSKIIFVSLMWVDGAIERTILNVLLHQLVLCFFDQLMQIIGEGNAHALRAVPILHYPDIIHSFCPVGMQVLAKVCVVAI